MSILETLGAASAASGLLEAATGIIERLRTAYERQQDLTRVLDKYSQEIRKTTAIIGIVKDEEALQTAAVASELTNIQAIGKKLIHLLHTLNPGDKGRMRQFGHQLVHGSRNEKKLSEIMDELGGAKANLSLCVQVTNVGLSRNANGALVANVAVVERIDLLLQQMFGEGRGLKIAELLKHQSSKDNDTVTLSDADLANKTSATSRIVIDNSTQDQALQINGPVGEKGWWEVSRLQIKNNKAVGQSIQVNHGTSLEVFKELLAVRAENKPS